MPEPERLERQRAAPIAYDVCRRALTLSNSARRAAMRPVLDAWVEMIAAARAAGVPVIYTTPVSRADGADVVMLPTDLSAKPECRRLPTPLRGRQRLASLTISRRGPKITSFSSAGRAPSTGRGSRSSCTCCGATQSSSAVAPPIAVSKRASARRSTSTLPVLWCANAVGAATQPPTPTASTKR